MEKNQNSKSQYNDNKNPEFQQQLSNVFIENCGLNQDSNNQSITMAVKKTKKLINDEFISHMENINEKNSIIDDLRRRHDNLKEKYDELWSAYKNLLSKFDQQKAETEKAQENYNEVVEALQNAANIVQNLEEKVGNLNEQI